MEVSEIQEFLFFRSIKNMLIIDVSGCIIIFLGGLFITGIMHKKNSKYFILQLIVFYNYLLALIYITFLNRLPGSRGTIELIPFKDIIGWDGNIDLNVLSLMVLNIILFIPFGFFISLWTKKINTIKRVLFCSVTSLSLSILIEAVQLITKRGYFEIEDLICNLFGGIIGCILALIISKISESLNKG